MARKSDRREFLKVTGAATLGATATPPAALAQAGQGEAAKALAHFPSDRVGYFFTINEFEQATDTGYHGVELMVQGQTVRLHIAPGLTLDEGPPESGEAACQPGPRSCRAGRAREWKAGHESRTCGEHATAVPEINSPEHVKAAEAATRDLNAYFLGPILEGKYSDAFLKAAGKDAPKFTDADLRVISMTVDFVGINVYIPVLLVVVGV